MPKSSPKRLLVVAAHPDDETFGCGGTIASEAALGSEVTVCCLTGTDARHRELKAACEVLGAQIIALKGKDLQLTVPEVAKTLIPIIQDVQPEIIISHGAGDYHPDHQVVHHAFQRAAEWAGHSTKYKSKAWRPQRLFTMEINTLLPNPTVLVDISDVIEVKTQAIEEYQSQLKKTDDYYLLFNLQKARLRGLQGACEYAEAFHEVLMPVHGPFYNPAPTVKSLF
jgi:LmbE family N-acetylglucosaminyl deacetylase